MLYSELQSILPHLSTLHFVLPDHQAVPAHYHVTEVALVDKKLIDCGGHLRTDKYISLQLWVSYDYDHRIHPEKLQNILSKAQGALRLENLPVEVEYQGDTIGRYDLEFHDQRFYLIPKSTTCLAGVPVQEEGKTTALKPSCC